MSCHFVYDIILMQTFLVIRTIQPFFLNIALAGNRFLRLFTGCLSHVWLICFRFLADIWSWMLEFFTSIHYVFFLIFFLSIRFWNWRSLSVSTRILVTRIIGNISEKLPSVRLHGVVHVFWCCALKIHLFYFDFFSLFFDFLNFKIKFWK